MAQIRTEILPGYRELKIGEFIRKDDLGWNSFEQKWVEQGRELCINGNSHAYDQIRFFLTIRKKSIKIHLTPIKINNILNKLKSAQAINPDSALGPDNLNEEEYEICSKLNEKNKKDVLRTSINNVCKFYLKS